MFKYLIQQKGFKVKLRESSRTQCQRKKTQKTQDKKKRET